MTPAETKEHHTEHKPKQEEDGKKNALKLGGAVAALALIGFGASYVIHSMHYESTDDAAIEAHVVPLSARISGQVTRVLVEDNQLVKAGDILAEIDPADYKVQVAQARARLAAATAEAVRAEGDAVRYQDLLKRDEISKQQLDNAEALAKAARAAVERDKAALDQAELNLTYTKVAAPEAGRVTRRAVEGGAYVQVGQVLLALVPTQVWVVANFKETQLRYMRPGQEATVKIDAYPGREFKAHVDSIQYGTGARFSLLPPENATGNFVKVVQRVPVKIVFDEPADPEQVLAPGMSVVPEVKVR